MAIYEAEDRAGGRMGKDDAGKIAMTRVTLRPVVVFAGQEPSENEHAAMHHEAHEKCFIANSVKTEVICKPSMDAEAS